MLITELVRKMPESKDDIFLDGWDLYRAAKENNEDITNTLIERGDGVDVRTQVTCPHNGWYRFWRQVIFGLHLQPLT